MDKSSLRRRIRAELTSLLPEVRAAWSAAICHRLVTAPGFLEGGVLLGFMPLPTEPDILPALLQAATRRGVALPRYNPDSGTYEPAPLTALAALRPGAFGILEPGPEAPPIPFERLDLVLVPGLAFDQRGGRLGRGRGFYDRMLARASRAGRWGVAFPPQVVPAVPCTRDDATIDVLVTPQLWLPLPAATSF